jgi:hypothetical protein
VIGAPCRTTAIAPAAPTSELAPTWLTKPDVTTAAMAPNGTDISSAGVAVMVSRVHACVKSSRTGRRMVRVSVTE